MQITNTKFTERCSGHRVSGDGSSVTWMRSSSWFVDRDRKYLTNDTFSQSMIWKVTFSNRIRHKIHINIYLNIAEVTILLPNRKCQIAANYFISGARSSIGCIPWWRHQMEAFSALLALCVGNSPVTGEFPAQRPVTRSFDVFFDLRLSKHLSKPVNVRLVIWDAIALIMTS